MLLSVNGIDKRYGTETVFENLSFTLDEGHKVALVGRNGAGKSTIMKIIAGMQQPDSGAVVLTNGREVTHLPQEIGRDEGRTGVEYIQDDTNLQPHQFFPVLEGLGVSQKIAGQKVNEMSGGQQTKILLTKFLLNPSDILLLDEPTNNLDIPSLLWLEVFLASIKKTMIVISHDLVFLNTVTNRVFELKEGALNVERGTYGDYLERKKKEFARQMKEYTLYQQKVRQLEKTKRNLQAKGEGIDMKTSSDSDKRSAGASRERASAGQRGVKSIEKRIARLGVVEKPFEEEPFTLSIRTRDTGGDVEIVTKDMVTGYKDGVQVGPVSFTLKFGDRICIMGANGSGKSTVLKTLTDIRKPLSGEVSVTENVVFGDLMQQHERVSGDGTTLDFFIQETGSAHQDAMHQLSRAGFTEQMIHQRVNGLSSGMRARLLFAVFTVLGVNVLVLDEPTNHLDMEAVIALKGLLKEYTGSVLLVSHNRWFLEELAIDIYYDIVDGRMERIRDFDAYVADMHARAERMVSHMNRILSRR